MTADNTVFHHLAIALRMELTAVNQYLLHSHLLRDWGFDKLADKMRVEMSEEARHADLLIERFLFLKGVPDPAKLDEIKVVPGVREVLDYDLESERKALSAYRDAAADCEKHGDYVTRNLFVLLISDEEHHIEWLEKQLGLMDRLGEGIYLQSQMGAAGSDSGA